MKKTMLIIATFLTAGAWQARSQQLRPPSYPLVTVDPYFSIWSANDTLSAGPTRHWTGKENSLQGIIRVDGKAYYFLGTPIADLKTVLPLTGTTGAMGAWKYTEKKPSEGWENLSYDDRSWQTARGAFSDGGGTPNRWKSPDLWTRRTFTLPVADPGELSLNIHHDDNVEVYLNGVLAYKATGWNNAPTEVKISPEARRALKKGANVMAIHVANTAGGAYLDAGLTATMPHPAGIPAADQTGYQITATQSVFDFTAGGVALKLTFTAPLVPDDLDLFSRPADYISFAARSADGKSHRVQLYFSAAGNIAVNTPDQTVKWSRSVDGNLSVMRVGTTSQNVLGRKGDNVRIDWGYLYLAAPAATGLTTAMAASAASVADFAREGKLSVPDDGAGPRAAGEKPITLAASYDLGTVATAAVDRHLILAYDDLYAIEYFHQRLKAWWKRGGMTTPQMLAQAEKDYGDVMKKCDAFDHRLYSDAVEAGGEKYAAICQLAYRQGMAACKLAAGPQGNPLLFTKECFSNGDISTVDVIFPGSPMQLLYNPTLVRALIDPIFYYCESGRWTAPNSPHDLGTYPIANGRKVEETMPIEETGNMIIMVAALARAEGNADYARKHWKVLSQWADYLLKFGMDPGNQLCTDDFAGPSAHNANLSIKAIMGIACYGRLAGMLGQKDVETRYVDSARAMATDWIRMDRDGDHYKLAFDRPGTWSQKYNLVWDRMLGMDIFPASVARDEIRYYLTKQKTFGLPLDSRKDYTKADWITWTATMARRREDFEALISRLYKYVDETPTRVPLSDWFWTTDAKQVGFQNRSVVGGFFIKTLDYKWNHAGK
jgi:hypothetical protein